MPRSRLPASAALGLLALLAGCLDDTASAPLDRSSPASLELRASVEAGAVDRDVGIRVYYLREGTPVDLPASPSVVRVTGGETRREAVTVQLAPCLADPGREEASSPGCRLYVELRLLDPAGATLDVGTVRAANAAVPGQAVDVPAIALADIASITVSSVPTLRVQDTRTLTATAIGAGGQPVAGRTFTWSTSNAAIVSIDATTGAITARAPGTATISASTGVRRGDASVRVIARVAAVTVSPSPASIRAGESQRLTAIPRDAAGAALELTERTITWQSSAPSVAAVDATGLVIGLRAGPATITATVDGVPGTAAVTVTVTPITLTGPTSAVVVGRTVAIEQQGAIGTVTWTSSDPTIASVDASGTVTARFPGTATITASTAAGQSATVDVTAQAASTVVTRATLESVSGSQGSIAGYSFALTGFAALDANGQVIQGVVPVWTSSNAGALAVQTSGSGVTATGGDGRGTVTLTARDARTGAVLRSDAYVVLNPVTGGNSALVATPTFVEATENQPDTVTVTLLDLNGAPQANRILRVSLSPAQAIVSAPARVRTGTNGQVRIPITIGDVPATAPSPYTVRMTISVEGDSRSVDVTVAVYHGSQFLRRTPQP